MQSCSFIPSTLLYPLVPTLLSMEFNTVRHKKQKLHTVCANKIHWNFSETSLEVREVTVSAYAIYQKFIETWKANMWFFA